MPVRASSTSSGLPPTRAATTGRPLAIASRIVFEMPSLSDGSTNRSSAASTSRHVAARAGDPDEAIAARRSRIRVSTCARAGPSPAITSRSCAARRVADRTSLAKASHQGNLVLERVEPPDRAADPELLALVLAPRPSRGKVAAGAVATCIHAVVNLPDALATGRRCRRAASARCRGTSRRSAGSRVGKHAVCAWCADCCPSGSVESQPCSPCSRRRTPAAQATHCNRSSRGCAYARHRDAGTATRARSLHSSRDPSRAACRPTARVRPHARCGRASGRFRPGTRLRAGTCRVADDSPDSRDRSRDRRSRVDR